MPGLPAADAVLAVLCSDLHFSHKKPSIRADDWYEVQTRYARQLESIRPAWDVPIICGGDVVDSWSQPPEFINWAIDNLPEMYSVCGQHDLPCHSYDELHKSAFWTLMKVGKIKMLTETPTAFQFPDIMLRVYGFGWEQIVRPPLPKEKGMNIIDLAVVHRYVWTKEENSYPDAPKEGNIRKMPLNVLDGYDAVLSGDNHRQFLHREEERMWFNPGTFLRRKSDEISHRPCVGLLKSDGSIERRYLDVSGDQFVDKPEAVEASSEGLEEFVEGLKSLDHSSLDFRDAMQRAVENERVRVRNLVLQAMEA